jgi:small-conductance mechanosensitive channel
VTAVIATLMLLLGASIAVMLFNSLLQHWLTRIEAHLHLSYTTVLLVARIISGTLWLLSVLLVLDIWGIGLGGLWSVLVSAVAVIGVGFLATWTIVSNFTASLFIALWRPFHLGNVVELIPENLKGRVIDRNLMFTVLREQNGHAIFIPNNLFFQKMFRVVDGAERSPFELIETLGNASSSRVRKPVLGTRLLQHE